MKAHCQAYILAGCTATGKSDVAHWIAAREGWTLLSADAMLVYRGMDIGTAKPPESVRGAVPYHGIDCVLPTESFSVGAWLREAETACRDAASRDRPLLVVGGSGLYVKLLLTGLDYPSPEPQRRRYWTERYRRDGLDGLLQALKELAPKLAEGLADARNPRRLIRALEKAEHGTVAPSVGTPVATLPLIAGLRMPRRERLHQRIAARVDAMWADGLLDEVRQLRHAMPTWSGSARQAIGYREAWAVLDGEMTEQEARERMIVRTRQLAKRQETWFRHQLRVDWVEVAAGESVASIAGRVLAQWRQHGPIEIACERLRDPRR